MTGFSELLIVHSFLSLHKFHTVGIPPFHHMLWSLRKFPESPLIADDHLACVGAAYAVAGRYEEARAALQRYLSRYPNMLPSHLMLAVVYSELGQAAEARAEAAEVLRLNPQFSLEVHRQRMPIKDPAVLERHLAALRKAGLK